MSHESFRSKAALALVGAALLSLPLGALAQEEGGTKTARELRADYDTNVKNKTVAFLPIALGVPLQDEWNRVHAAGLDRAGERQAGCADRAES